MRRKGERRDWMWKIYWGNPLGTLGRRADGKEKFRGEKEGIEN